jgi:hypothetical protein
MDVASSKKGVKKSTFTEASTENGKKGLFGCCESSWGSIKMPSNTFRHVRHDVIRGTFTATEFSDESAEKPCVLREHFQCLKY